jgi:hypothetical protein
LKQNNETQSLGDLVSSLYLSSSLLCREKERADENRWHETQAVYSCDFQPLPLAQLKRLLAEDDSSEKDKDKIASSSTGPIIAGGRQYRLATGGGDSKVRVSLFHKEDTEKTQRKETR